MYNNMFGAMSEWKKYHTKLIPDCSQTSQPRPQGEALEVRASPRLDKCLPCNNLSKSDIENDKIDY